MKQKLLDVGIRVQIDSRDEKLGYRMRESQTKKIPYTLVIGEKEVETNTVNYRIHGSSETNVLNVDDFCSLMIKKINDKDL